MTPLLTPDEARQLREARILLVKVGVRAQAAFIASDDSAESWSLGKLHEAADIAEHGVFNVCSTALHFCDVSAANIGLGNVYEDARQ